MVSAYLELASKASFADIASCWEVENRLDGLLLAKGIDISEFEKAGISFGRPRKMEIGVYRLIREIHRVHHGVMCKCTRFYGCCRRFPESSFLSIETVIEYGFDTLNPWERWQMMVLYRDLFSLDNFDSREMPAARRSRQRGASLQDYIERMVDTRKYWNKYKAGGLFPDARGYLDWETSRIPLCYCFCH